MFIYNHQLDLSTPKCICPGHTKTYLLQETDSSPNSLRIEYEKITKFFDNNYALKVTVKFCVPFAINVTLIWPNLYPGTNEEAMVIWTVSSFCEQCSLTSASIIVFFFSLEVQTPPSANEAVSASSTDTIQLLDERLSLCLDFYRLPPL